MALPVPQLPSLWIVVELPLGWEVRMFCPVLVPLSLVVRRECNFLESYRMPPLVWLCLLGRGIMVRPRGLDKGDDHLMHSDFNPSSETFNKILIWVRLSNLPFHLWADPLLEEVGDALGDFLMVDDGSSDICHSTFSLLVKMDVSKGLPAEILLKYFKGFWV
ncbi:hypothetical protein SUGI_0469560 [Cryptomeria japonica]|nr:hypothetical protein SUGI_0469560 [Cryptomeria japonica]